MANNNSNNMLLDPALFGEPQTVQSVVNNASMAWTGTLGERVASDALTQLNQVLVALQSVSQAAEWAKENTKAIQQTATTEQSGGGSSTLSVIGHTLEGVLGFGLGLSPLISGIVSLFGGGGGSEAPPALTKYVPPSKVSVSGGISDAFPGQTFGVDYSQGNHTRPVSSNPPQSNPPQITVQVQAMDSQSFLDHSTDIALAVRQAMLESSVLNDLIREV
jgi:hypothetical protein